MNPMNLLKRRPRVRVPDPQPLCAVNLHGKRYRLTPGNDKFWRKVAAGQWERNTFRFLDRCLRADSVYLDVGAWIGPTVLFAATRCKTVYCVEPDPVAYQRLLANLQLNRIDNVLPFHGALAVANGAVHIANAENFGNSETRVTPEATSGSEDSHATVLAITLSDLLNWWGIKRIDLLKMDIEGAEFALIPSLIDLLSTGNTGNTGKPHIHLSLHAPFLPPSERHHKLAAAVELAGHYAFIYDKHLKRIAPEAILQEPFTEKCNAVALTDEALF